MMTDPTPRTAGALYAGAAVLTSAQHMAAACTELACELADHPTLCFRLNTATSTIGLNLDPRATTYAQRQAFLDDLARITGAEVEHHSPHMASVYARDWRGTGISVDATEQVAEDPDPGSRPVIVWSTQAEVDAAQGVSGDGA